MFTTPAHVLGIISMMRLIFDTLILHFLDVLPTKIEVSTALFRQITTWRSRRCKNQLLEPHTYQRNHIISCMSINGNSIYYQSAYPCIDRQNYEKNLTYLQISWQAFHKILARLTVRHARYDIFIRSNKKCFITIKKILAYNQQYNLITKLHMSKLNSKSKTVLFH